MISLISDAIGRANTRVPNRQSSCIKNIEHRALNASNPQDIRNEIRSTRFIEVGRSTEHEHSVFEA